MKILLRDLNNHLNKCEYFDLECEQCHKKIKRKD